MIDGMIPFREAARRPGANSAATWPARGEPNRLEPECWPVLRPSFTVAKGATVFTMGSCFARNIETHLDRLGFAVPAVTLTRSNSALTAAYGAEIFNKYTPTSIAQELEWARTIYDRDDTLTEQDVMPLLLQLGEDRYVDLHARADPGFGLPFDEQMARRRLIYSWLRTAFDCDLAVVTLGLIETWWDTRVDQSIEMHPRALRHPDAKHFGFKPLDYTRSLSATRQALSVLLRNPRTKVLITTSPVPLETTFTTDDVIIANMMSKSILRAVAGTVTQDNDRVDYFPSYESVMLTKQASVWMNDLIHIEQAFVGRIMARVVEAYVVDAATSQYEQAMAFSTAVMGGAIDDAAPLYEVLRDGPGDPALHALPLDLAHYEIAVGDAETARKRLRALHDSGAETAEGFRFAWLLQSVGEDVAAEEQRQRAFAQIAGNWAMLEAVMVQMHRQGRDDEHLRLMQKAETTFIANPDVLARLALFYRDRGDEPNHQRLLQAAALAGGTPEQIAYYAQQFLSAGNHDAAHAIVSLLKSPEHSPEASRQLATIASGRQRFDEAASHLKRRLDAAPDDVIALGMYAVALTQAGREVEALVAGRRALSLDSDDPRIPDLVARLEARGDDLLA